MENQFSGACPPCPHTTNNIIWKWCVPNLQKESEPRGSGMPWNKVTPMTIAASLKANFPRPGPQGFRYIFWCLMMCCNHPYDSPLTHLFNQIYCFTPVIITGLALEAKDWKPWIQYYPPTTAFCLHFSPSTKSKNRTYQMHLLKYCVSSFRYIYIYIHIYLDLSTFWPPIYIFIYIY